MFFSRKKLLASIDHQRIEAAIGEAEKRSSGEVRVCVAPFFWGRVQKTAERAFERMGMAATRERNGVLFFFVPSRRRFAVLGDKGIHEKVGPEFWTEVSDCLSKHFRQGDYNGGLAEAIDLVGHRLAEHFPADPNDNPDELPNHVVIL